MTPQTHQTLRDYVRAKLGAPAAEVELTDEQIDFAIDDALGMFNHYLCKAEPRVLASQSGAVQIPLQLTDRGVTLCKIMFPEDTRVYAQMNIFEIMYRMVFPRMPLGEWYLLKSFYKLYQQIRGTEPDWYVDANANVLYVDCWSGPYDIFYVVAKDFTVEDISRLKSALLRDFRELTLAEAKVTLSRIRGKFGGSIPVPGGTLQTDADTLRAEGEAKKIETEGKLESMARFQSPPIMWM